MSHADANAAMVVVPAIRSGLASSPGLPNLHEPMKVPALPG
jgi:hypothetical protein